MSDQNLGLESAKIKELRDDYVRRGYRILSEKRMWPSFLQEFDPDLVADSDNDKVVVGVRVRHHPDQRLGVFALAEAVGGQPEWRFELVVLDHVEAPKTLSTAQVSIRLDEAQLVYRQSKAGGFLLVWSAIEALLRTTLDQSAIEFRGNSQIALVKTAASQGLISQDTSDLFVSAAKLRNRVAHGLEADATRIAPRPFDALVRVARDLLESIQQQNSQTETGVSPSEMVEWFFENYEDPANEVPYDSGEGGYVYHRGGPYNAEDILVERFPDASEDDLEAAIGRINDDGWDWVRRGQYP